jgi:hypothetical protein
MKTNKFAVPVLLTTFCLTGWAGSFSFMNVNDQRRNDGSDVQRPSASIDVKRNEMAGGRRLTAAELAQLRQQVRQQWAPRQDVATSAETRTVDHIAPVPAAKGITLDSPGRPRR